MVSRRGRKKQKKPVKKHSHRSMPVEKVQPECSNTRSPSLVAPHGADSQHQGTRLDCTAMAKGDATNHVPNETPATMNNSSFSVPSKVAELSESILRDIFKKYHPSANLHVPTYDITTRSESSMDCVEFIDLTEEPAVEVVAPSIVSEPATAEPERRPLELKRSSISDENVGPREGRKRQKMREAVANRVPDESLVGAPVGAPSCVKSVPMETTPRQEFADIDNRVAVVATTDAEQIPRSLLNYIIYEWFYSDIDRALFAEGSDKKFEFRALLRTHFPALVSRSLKRADWNYIRQILCQIGGEPARRRCLRAFMLSELTRLEARREKIRFLQENQLFEYLEDDLPQVLPPPITIGSEVKAKLNSPQYGVFKGTVVGINEKKRHEYMVSFPSAELTDQFVPDYRLALVKNKQDCMVPVTHKLLKQILVLEETLKKKRSFLDQMAHLRCSIEARRKMGKPIGPQDRAQAHQYVVIVRQLVLLDRAILQQEKPIHAMHTGCADGSPALEELGMSPLIDRDVPAVAQELLAGYMQCSAGLEGCGSNFNPEPELHWNRAVQRLQGNPARLNELRQYIQPTIGTALRYSG